MSGGAFDYAYYKVLEFAYELSERIGALGDVDQCGSTPNKFSKEALEKLRDIEHKSRHVSQLMREVEWLYSGDISEESFMQRISAIEDGD